MIFIVYALYLSSASHRAVHVHCVYQDDVAVADSGNTLTGQYAVHCIPAFIRMMSLLLTVVIR
ncbi:hypothetical protein O5190_13335 [Escherichia coli]|nr:hypothetical protein [Escherichia coli]